jgi:hypothetical protein
VRTPSAVVAFCCLLLARPALAEVDWANAALPRCKPVHETRTPVPYWHARTTPGRILSSVPPQGDGRLVYLDVIIPDQGSSCWRGTDKDGDDFVLEVPAGTPGVGATGLRVHVDDVESRALWLSCRYRGFYVNEPARGGRDGWSETSFRPVEMADVLTSGRYCRSDGAATASFTRWDAAAATPPASEPLKVLSTCRRSGEDRMPIPVWRPTFSAAGYLTSVPPQGYGRLVYITAVLKGNCQGYTDMTDTYVTPEDLKHPTWGGFNVELSGPVHAEGGQCMRAGVFVNTLPSFAQGWSTTYFQPVDESKVAASGQYCLARRHGPLVRVRESD